MSSRLFLSEALGFAQSLFLNKIHFINLNIFCLYRKGYLLDYLPEEDRNPLDLPGLTLLKWTVLRDPPGSPSWRMASLLIGVTEGRETLFPICESMPSSWWVNSLSGDLSRLTTWVLFVDQVLEYRWINFRVQWFSRKRHCTPGRPEFDSQIPPGGGGEPTPESCLWLLNGSCSLWMPAPISKWMNKQIIHF